MLFDIHVFGKAGFYYRHKHIRGHRIGYADHQGLLVAASSIDGNNRKLAVDVFCRIRLVDKVVHRVQMVLRFDQSRDRSGVVWPPARIAYGSER
jgi:hypothetical protein